MGTDNDRYGQSQSQSQTQKPDDLTKRPREEDEVSDTGVEFPDREDDDNEDDASHREVTDDDLDDDDEGGLRDETHEISREDELKRQQREQRG
ncbi:hypothetical protein [Paracoccus laeviglucosivorans]|uniref:Uncharacterized protein n=1 Tax=Paracoccus laeviglucosivorans TaxID=1197861 RepID=A0A521CZP5_9RHOB|nr:hypothetical protein [Paracoccus laeviglucosivorans]SMO64130.1 hypothetical protein SAMN06265221_105258 [Paracoccus laeviglucosivorans]